jgi:hypothetical protein
MRHRLFSVLTTWGDMLGTLLPRAQKKPGNPCERIILAGIHSGGWLGFSLIG